MSKGINKVILIGNLGSDPEVVNLASGDILTNVSIATSDSWVDKVSGEKKEVTEWHKVVFYKRLAEIVSQYLKKGSKVYVEGRLETKKWTDKEGIERYTTQVIASNMQMLDRIEQKRIPEERSYDKTSVKEKDIFLDDDIPF